MKAAARWASEADMLAAFRREAERAGFRVVPEACGHDMILVATRTWSEAELEPPERWTPKWKAPSALAFPWVEVGDVVAVEGKLHRTPTLLRQALPAHRRHGWQPHATTDFSLVVVPTVDHDFRDVAEALDIGVAVMEPAAPAYGRPTPRLRDVTLHERHRVLGFPRVSVTSLDIDIPAGSPAPRALTPWKLAAVRFCLAALDGHEFGREAFPEPLRPRTFVDREWVRMVRRDGRKPIYVLADGPGRPDREYPEIVEALAREAAS